MKRLFRYWNTETDGISLHLFRIVFCSIIAFKLYKFYHTCIGFAHFPFHLTYDFFHFVRPISGTLADVLFYIFGASAVLAALGIWFKPTLFIALTGFTYSFLIDKTIYNNHYYLFILIGLLLLFSDAGKGLTIRNPFQTATVPMRQIWALRFMFCVVYFYGGINKLNYDWLVYAEPIAGWLPSLIGKWVLDLPAVQYKIIAFCIAYIGLLIDLLSGIFLLFESRMKYIMLCILLLFHISNSLFFGDIGYFPFVSIVALMLYINPQTVKKILHNFFPKTISINYRINNKIANYALLIFVIIQLLVPLRHWLIEGNYAWHERAWLFSWTMKLREKQTNLKIFYSVSGYEGTQEIPYTSIVTPRQARHLETKPTSLIQFAHFMEEKLRLLYEDRDIQIYALAFVRFNHYHPPQLIIDPYTDLTSINIKNSLSIDDYSWIIPPGKDKYGISPPEELLSSSNYVE